MSRVWSTYQQDIFNFIENETGNGIIEAVAGSGKSTTIVEGMRRIPNGATAIFLAFNKSIAEELKARGVNARTFHSLTYSPVLRAIGASTVTADKLQRLVKTNMTGEQSMAYGRFATRLVGLARQAGIDALLDDREAVWMDIVEYHDLELEDEKASYSEAIDFSRKLLQWSNASDMVDFDDLLYRAVRDGVSLPKFDFVFVDEAQDTNAIQRAILRKIIKPSSRIVAVGDPAQAIYGFRGADGNSLAILGKEFGCRRLPLTVSYRCPTKVVEFAREWVKHIEAAPGAPEGQLEVKQHLWRIEDFVAGDLVVCRTSAPLLALGYRMLRAKRPVTILVREIGQGLLSLIAKMNAKNIDELESRLNSWVTREVEKAVAKENESKIASIQDKADALQCLIDGLAEDQRTIEELKMVITKLFSDAAAATILCTIHKAKGLEADTVYWLNASQCPSRWAKKDWQKAQERNLCYVAVTRAKQRLVLIEQK